MSLALLVPAIPLLGSVVTLLLSGTHRSAVATVAVLGPAGALGATLVLAERAPWEQPIISDGIEAAFQPLPLATTVDGLSISVAVMVASVATLIQLYSVGYMRHQARYPTYAAFVSLFTAAMLMVVVAGDVLLLLIGWEVMGLCSYLLIGQDWEQRDARAAAVKAFLVTKAADVGFIVGCVVLIGATGTLLLPQAVQAAAADPTVAALVSALVLLGVIGKSAQVPLHGWLPDAMAGPSPVSALIHAATMVAAGIYVIARIYPVFLATPNVLNVMTIIGSFTMLFAAIAALAQDDLKRVLAWSTVSQLAYMIGALGVAARDAAIYHLLAHAFFKSLLFLCAGAIIFCVGTSYLPSLGRLRAALPLTFITMTIGLLALIGIFPLAGFFSKESILVAAEKTAQGDTAAAEWSGWLLLIAGIFTIALTAAYAIRLWLMTWGASPTNHVHMARTREVVELPKVMAVPLVLLSVPTVALGALVWQDSWLPGWMKAGATEPSAGPGDLDAVLATTLASAVAVIVGLAGYLLMRGRAPEAVRQQVMQGSGWDTLYATFVVRPFEAVSASTRIAERVLARTADAVAHSTGRLGVALQHDQQGDVQRYLSTAFTVVVVGIVVVVVAAATA